MIPMQRAITSAPHNVDVAGHWSIVARPSRDQPVNLTTFRGLPTQIGSMSFSDPFGPAQMQLTFPGVTLFDRLGQGDLYWAKKHVDIDVIWVGDLPPNYPFGMHTKTGVVPAFRWEGYIARFDPKTAGLSIQLKGAMLQLDRWLAKPEYPARPLPYEWAIQRQFLGKPALRMHPLRVLWPSWWQNTYKAITGKPSYLIPAGVTAGQPWTGLLTRNTGSFDPVLTNYIQSLLASMYTDRGRWTMDLDINRQPVLLHSDFVHAAGPEVVEIDPADPGVEIDLSEDWEQAITTVYSQGTSLSGVAYTGMQINADGSLTSYRPAAAQRQVWPATTDNDWYDDQVMPAEVMLQTQPGLSSDDAAIVARNHLSRFGDPGMTGTIVLKTDPKLNGVTVPRMLLRAGMDVHVPRLFGKPEGLILHVSASEANFTDGSVSLTVDTKQRDALTVEEVRTRGRDSLQISRMLVAGQYQPPVPDQMMPWSYAEGSGFIPSNPLFNALPLFNGMPDTINFPWTDWTTQRPPKNSRWRNCYLRIGPASSNASDNWAVQHSSWGSAMGAPIKVGQAGSIRLLQVAAYDANGNVLKVPFHISFYYVGSVNVLSMPAIPVQQASMFPPYAPNQRYPFVRDAFESFLVDGTRAGLNDPTAYEAAGPIRIYGTFYEKAGFYPGSYSDGDEPTGLLVDETLWSWDLSGTSDSDIWDPYSVEKNLTSAHSGNIYAMIYCDAQQDQEVFFMGRMFRAEPGVGGQS